MPAEQQEHPGDVLDLPGDVQGHGAGRGDRCVHRPATPDERSLADQQVRAQRHPHEEGGQQRETGDDEEDRAPAEQVDQGAGDERPGDRGEHPRRREQREDAGPEVGRVRVTDGDVHRGEGQPGAEALGEATEHEHVHRGRQPGEQQSAGEAEATDEQGQPGPRASAQVPPTTMPTMAAVSIPITAIG